MNLSIVIGVIGAIASIIAAIVAYVSLRFTIRNSKGYILKQIDNKKNQIRRLTFAL